MTLNSQNAQYVNFGGIDNVTYVDSIADLRLLKPSVNGEVVIASGSSLLGDGLGSMYVWSDTATGTDDGANIILSQYSGSTGRWLIIQSDTSATALVSSLKSEYASSTGSSLIGYQYTDGSTIRTIQNKLKDYVTVKDFGAIGDGSSHPLSSVTSYNSQNTTGWTLTQWQTIYPKATALTQEIDYLAHQLALDTYNLIFAPPGTYLFGQDTLTLPSRDGVRLIGAGRDSTTWESSNATADIICFSSTAQSGQEVSYGTINSSVQKTAGSAIKMTGGHTYTSRGMTFGGNMYINYNLLAWTTQFNYLIEDFEINSGAIGIQLGDGDSDANWVQNVWILNGLIYNTTENGINYSNVSGFYVENVDVGSGAGNGHNLAPSSGQVVTAGQLSNTGGDTMGGAGIICYQPGGTVSNIRWTKAWVSNCGKTLQSTNTYQSGIYLDAGNGNNRIANITFDSPLVFRCGAIGVEIIDVKNISFMDAQVHDNGLVTTSSHGMYINCDSFNIIGGAVGPTPTWSSDTQDYGIFLDSGCLDYYIAGVNLNTNTIAGMKVATDAKEGVITGCSNWKTKSNGSIEMLSGQSSITVTTDINPDILQTCVFVSQISSLQGASQYWVSAVSGNTFTLTLNGTLTANAYFNWFIDQESTNS